MDHHNCWYSFLSGIWYTDENPPVMEFIPCHTQVHPDHNALLFPNER